jgi:hypothetical protein
VFAACGTGEPTQLGSIHVKSQQVTAAAGATMEITAAEHAELAGTKLVIPAGALQSDTKITIGIDPDALTDEDSEVSGPVVVFGPSGTTFSAPAELSIPYSGLAEEDLIRVVVREDSGAFHVLMPEHLTFDAATKTVRFRVEHFTRFQSRRARRPCAHLNCPSNTCRRGRCQPPPPSDCADPNSCGPAPGVPSWTCEDGTAGGSTGRCIAQPNGGCGWEIIWCPRACTNQECGPQPEIATRICADGSTGGLTGNCVRNNDGSCGWEIRQCPDACANVRCPAGTSCDPTTGQCQNTGGQCGNVTCGPGTVCCNASCGMCAPPGTQCTQQACNACSNGILCGPGQQCDPATGQCANICDPNTCGPQPGVPNWVCEDGTVGGPTGRCLPTADGSCGWEINWCPRACTNSECGPEPGNSLVPCNHTCRRDPNGTCTWSGCVEECQANECGPQPGVPNQQCADGTSGGPTGRCLRDPATNVCGWEIRPCPN